MKKLLLTCAALALAIPAFAKSDALSLIPNDAVTVGMVRIADMRSSPLSSALFQQTDKVSNVADHFRYTLGDLEKGFAEADVVVEREFNTATVHQGYIEPHNATALWNNDGRVKEWLRLDYWRKNTMDCGRDDKILSNKIDKYSIRAIPRW